MSTRGTAARVAIDEVTSLQERTFLQRVFQSQPFWVTVALVVICLVMSWLQPDAFPTTDNFFNVTRNFAFIGIMALGMTCVILTGGIDLSVGSIMGFVGVLIGLVLQASAIPIPIPTSGTGLVAWGAILVATALAVLVFRLALGSSAALWAGLAALFSAYVAAALAVQPEHVAWLVLPPGSIWIVATLVGLVAGAVLGAINGVLIAHLGLPAFVVTLGMLAAARSLAIVLSQNKMIYDFGPDANTFYWIGGGQVLGIANPVWVLVALTALFGFVFNFTSWGRWLYAIGGNENAARLTGVPVERTKFQAYVVSGLMTAIATVLSVSWAGSALNAMGQGWELRVIAATVIGGANLMGGEGGAYGAFIGAALIEVIRNSLLMAGVDANWQGTFVGIFIVLAVLLQKVRGRARD
ncbi:Ribose import permease protein RbsC [bacterium HR40]|nr:Ribose import permease protein RbsC [bacterium HR40]